jgi:hypothetical protein
MTSIGRLYEFVRVGASSYPSIFIKTISIETFIYRLNLVFREGKLRRSGHEPFEVESAMPTAADEVNQPIKALCSCEIASIFRGSLAHEKQSAVCALNRPAHIAPERLS